MMSTTVLRVYAWTERAEDLCGDEVEETDGLDATELPDTMIALLQEVARTHMPQLLANAKALNAGEKSFETEIEGLTWSLPSFPYQGKCRQWIREKYNLLQGEDLGLANHMLDASGLRALVEEFI